MDEAEQITGEKVRVPIALKWLETLLITAFSWPLAFGTGRMIRSI